jgi:hypothetical protein
MINITADQISVPELVPINNSPAGKRDRRSQNEQNHQQQTRHFKDLKTLKTFQKTTRSE